MLGTRANRDTEKKSSDTLVRIAVWGAVSLFLAVQGFNTLNAQPTQEYSVSDYYSDCRARGGVVYSPSSSSSLYHLQCVKPNDPNRTPIP